MATKRRDVILTCPHCYQQFSAFNASSKPGAVVLDAFAGTGSTLLAAQRLGREAIGIELDERYHATAQRRIQETETQMELPL